MFLSPLLKVVSRLSCYQLFLIPLLTRSYVLCNAIYLFRSGYLSGLLTYYSAYMRSMGRDISVGIATRYGLDGLGIESWWWRDFPHLYRAALRPTQLQGLPPDPRPGGLALNAYPHLASKLQKE